MNVGAPELIIILVIAIVVFGAGRVGELGSALGKGIREFAGQRFCGTCGTALNDLAAPH